MITVGSYYLNQCGPSPPFYTIWLIVGGVVTAFFFLSIMVFMCDHNEETDEAGCCGNSMLCLGTVCFMFALGWFVAGCVYIWGYDWDGQCFWIYYFMYGLVCGPFIVLGLILLLFIIVCFGIMVEAICC